MKNWLTTHYPHPSPDDVRWHVYLQRQHKAAVTGVAVGDRVFFYEYKRQKPIKGAGPYPTGRQGIVRVGTVCGNIYHRETVIEYADGKTGYWSWGVPTDKAMTDGFVKLKDLLEVIDYKPRSVLFGFSGGTGVMELDDSQASQLLGLFKGAGKRKT